jgi:formyl-CoA transferase
VGNDGQYHRFCAAAERNDLTTDPRFATNTLRVQHRTTLVPLLEGLFKTRTTKQWEGLLVKAEVPHAPVWDYAELFSHPQITARGLKVTVRDPEGRPVDLVGSPFHISGTTPAPPEMPPRLGQHTEQVLQELLGLDGARLADLRRQGII